MSDLKKVLGSKRVLSGAVTTKTHYHDLQNLSQNSMQDVYFVLYPAIIKTIINPKKSRCNEMKSGSDTHNGTNLKNQYYENFKKQIFKSNTAEFRARLGGCKRIRNK